MLSYQGTVHDKNKCRLMIMTNMKISCLFGDSLVLFIWRCTCDKLDKHNHAAQAQLVEQTS